MHFIKENMLLILSSLVPFSLGTLLIVLEPIIKEKNARLGTYSKVVGIVVTILISIYILSCISSIVSEFI